MRPQTVPLAGAELSRLYYFCDWGLRVCAPTVLELFDKYSRKNAKTLRRLPPLAPSSLHAGLVALCHAARDIPPWALGLSGDQAIGHISNALAHPEHAVKFIGFAQELAFTFAQETAAYADSKGWAWLADRARHSEKMLLETGRRVADDLSCSF